MRHEMTQDQYERLPKYARLEIDRLKRERDTALEDRNAALQLAVKGEDGTVYGGPGDERTATVLVSNPYARVPVHPRASMRIYLGQRFDSYVDLRRDSYRDGSDPFVQVHGGQGIVIAPRSSNAAEIRLAGW